MTSEDITHFYGCRLTTSKSVKLHTLKKQIALLADIEAMEKELISLYIPTNSTIDEVIARLKDFDCDIYNSKNHILEVLKNIIQRLKLHKTVPENGLAIFAGYPTYNSNINYEEILPPEPVNAYLCVIDNHYDLEPLRDLLRDQRIVGLLAVDSKKASLGLVTGSRLNVLDCVTSGIPGKTGKGGQSQRRYERERDMELTSYFHRVAEHAAKEFLVNRRITALIVGGPGQTKADFLKGTYLNYELQNAVLSIFDTQSAEGDALRELQSKSSNILMGMCGPEEKEIMERLLQELNKQSGLAIFGLDPVLDGLKRGTVEVALVTDTNDLEEYSALCKKCGNIKNEILDRRDATAIDKLKTTPCVKCQAVDYEIIKKDMVDVLEDAASKTNARVEVIFTDSEEKAKLKSFGGFAAILRFKPSG